MASSGGTLSFDFNSFGIESGQTITVTANDNCYVISPSEIIPDFCNASTKSFNVLGSGQITCVPDTTQTIIISAKIGRTTIATKTFTRCPPPLPDSITIHVSYNEDLYETQTSGFRYLWCTVSTNEVNPLSDMVIDATTAFTRTSLSNIGYLEYSVTGSAEPSQNYYLFVGLCGGSGSARCTVWSENTPTIENVELYSGSKIDPQLVPLIRSYQWGLIFGPFNVLFDPMDSYTLKVTGRPSRL